MSETIGHTALQTHSAPFALSGGIYGASVSGTIGSDAIELVRLVSGSPVSLDPPARFDAIDKGGTRTTAAVAGTYRWIVPGAMHNVNTNISKM